MADINQKLEDFNEFINIAKNVIYEYSKISEYNNRQLNVIKEFIFDEATDHQIMSMLFEGKLSDKYIINEEYTAVHNLTEFEKIDNLFDNIENLNEAGFLSKIKKTFDKGIEAFHSKLEMFPDSELKKYAESPQAEQYDQGFQRELKQGKDNYNNLSPEAKKGYLILKNAYKQFKQYRQKDIKKKSKEKPNDVFSKEKDFGAPDRRLDKSKPITIKKPSDKQITGKLKQSNSAGAVASVGSKFIKYLGGLALATVLIYAAYKVYKNYFSKAAKSCAGNPNKNICMIRYKQNAIKAQISDLQRASGSCNKSKEPAKCKFAIKSKIDILKNKIRQMENQIKG